MPEMVSISLEDMREEDKLAFGQAVHYIISVHYREPLPPMAKAVAHIALSLKHSAPAEARQMLKQHHVEPTDTKRLMALYASDSRIYHSDIEQPPIVGPRMIALDAKAGTQPPDLEE